MDEKWRASIPLTMAWYVFGFGIYPSFNYSRAKAEGWNTGQHDMWKYFDTQKEAIEAQAAMMARAIKIQKVFEKRRAASPTNEDLLG